MFELLKNSGAKFVMESFDQRCLDLNPLKYHCGATGAHLLLEKLICFQNCWL